MMMMMIMMMMLNRHHGLEAAQSTNLSKQRWSSLRSLYSARFSLGNDTWAWRITVGFAGCRLTGGRRCACINTPMTRQSPRKHNITATNTC